MTVNRSGEHLYIEKIMIKIYLKLVAIAKCVYFITIDFTL